MADLKLKVTPEEVRNKAGQITAQKALMEGIMSDLQTKVTSLEEYWKSTSGQSYVEQYANVTKNIQASLNALAQHVTNLTDVATSYETLETKQTTNAKNLSTEQIFNS